MWYAKIIKENANKVGISNNKVKVKALTELMWEAHNNKWGIQGSKHSKAL